MAFTLVAGCADILGIDNEYVMQPAEIATGGTSGNGGVSGKGGGAGNDTGGNEATGGEAATGGETAAGGDDAGPPDTGCTAGPCGAGKKCCSGDDGKASCVLPAPIFGCSLDSCERCPMPPVEGVAICQNGACDVACNPGFELVGAACEPIQSGTGGSVGAGGTTATGGGTSTGGAAACDKAKCGGCGPAGPFGCCKNDHTCGCTWAPSSGNGAYCL